MNKKGFTLVELLACVVVISVLLLIIIPTVNNSVKERKENLFFTSAKAILRQVEYNTFDSGESKLYSLSSFELTDISSSDYDIEESTIKVENGNISLYLIGQGKFENMYLCDITSTTIEMDISYDSCDIFYLASNYVKNAADEDELDVDEENDIYRYIGANPNNYIYFNCKDDSKDSCEIWRIVGAFGDKLKIVNINSLVSASWDSSDSEINGGKGVNEWSESDLMHLLNGYYYDSDYYQAYDTCKYCLLSGKAECLNTCNFSKLTNYAKQMIDDEAVWNTESISYEEEVDNSYEGGRNADSDKLCVSTSRECDTDENDGGTPIETCTYVCNDTVDRSSVWTGAVGLITAADYVLASGNEIVNSDEDMGDDNWLNFGENYWTMSPYASYTHATRVWRVNYDGHLGYFTASRTDSKSMRVYPVVYLKENVAILSGDGSLNNPYYASIKTSANYNVTVTFDTGGSENNVSDRVYEIGRKYGELPTVTKTGYSFVGWYTENDKLVTNKTKAKKDVTKLYAHWIKYQLATNFISELYSNEASGLKKDTTTAQNIRYYGSDPNNYVMFNGELWRIIGVIDGKLKIVRNTSLIQASWDSSSSSINNGYGINEWSSSDLKKLLNDYYYSGTSSCLYCNSSKQSTCTGVCSFSKLNTTAKSLIASTTWYTASSNRNTDSRTALSAYTQERGTGNGKMCSSSSNYCNDTVTRTTTWTGSVGLINVSDYAYAATTCNSYNESDCGLENWLNHSDSYWTITPFADANNARYVWRVDEDGHMGYINSISNTDNVYPSVYLKNDVYIISGTGTQTNPYIVSNLSSTVTVAFDSQGGKISENKKMVSVNSQYGDLPTPEKTGFDFLGWYTSITGGELVTSSSIVTNTSNHTLYARYENKAYTITYSKNNGEGTMESTVCHANDNCVLRTNTFTRSNYTFAGWSKYPNGEVMYSDGETVNNLFDSYDGILYAIWNEITYSLTIELDGGTITNDKTGNYTLGTSINLGKPTKSQYLFTEWQVISGTGTITNNTIEITGNVTVKAIYARANTTYLYINALTDSDIITDDADNKRYTGSDPNNYVTFNGETWRIIGNVNGKTKIVRNSSLLSASWDSSSSSINKGYGINEWSTSDIKNLLNNYYYSGSSSCYYCNSKTQSNCSNSCNFSQLSSTAKNMIDANTTWYIASANCNNSGSTVTTYTASVAYERERGSGTGKTCSSSTTCNDSTTRTTTWTGAVGLISVSDYAYASKNCSKYTLTSCGTSNWLNFYKDYWTITTYTSDNASRVRYVKSDGSISYYNAYNNFAVYPVVYLKSDVYIQSGEGTSSNPYILAI